MLNQNTVTPTITAPVVVGEETLVFQVAVTDGQYSAANSVRVVAIDPSIANKILKTPDYMNDLAGSIDNATQYVYAAIYYVEDYSTNKVLNALQNAKDRGVDVRLSLSTNSLVLYPSVEDGLIARGIPYNWSTSHAKVAVIDGKIAYVGYPNWNNNCLEGNCELDIKTTDSDNIHEPLH